MSVPDDIKKLFDAYLDGHLTDAGMERLEAWIAADERHADAFMEWTALQSWTLEALRSQSLAQVIGESDAVKRFVFPEHDDVWQAMESPGGPRSSERRALKRGWRALAVALAATLLLMAFNAWSIYSRRGEKALSQVTASSVLDVDRAADANGDNVAATLTRLENCVWQNRRATLGYGQQLISGDRIRLRSGVARIAFESGATALLEGPCDFVVDSAMQGTIRRGRVLANVPPRAFGFRIRSPDAEIIDLGTEFGVAVTDGHSEVHVFKGEVLSRRMNARGEQQGELLHITENDAIKFGASAPTPSRISSNTTKFVRRLTSHEPDEANKALPVSDDLALWLAADIGVKTERDDRVVAWPDILLGDNATSEDALQPLVTAQPQLVAQGINGKPAVRFDGSSSYLVTTPLETTDNQTILMVCQFSQHALRPGRKRGGQVLNYNGPPHRLVSSTFEPGVLQIGEPIVEGFASSRIGGKLFAGRLEGRDVSESEIYADPVGADAPVLLTYCYDLKTHTATLWANGSLAGSEPALRPAGITSRKVIGRHGFMKYFFDGDLAELLIFNRALSAEQLEQLTRYLGGKYKIPINGAETKL